MIQLMDLSISPEDALDFWFGPPPHSSRAVWFRKDAAFDTTIRTRFGEAVRAALAGEYSGWSATPHETLARVILLDQFPRNMHRDTPLAFAGKAQDGRSKTPPGRRHATRGCAAAVSFRTAIPAKPFQGSLSASELQSSVSL